MKTTWILLFIGVLTWSAINPTDRPTWWLEVAPALMAAAVLWATRVRFPLTPLAYGLILFHCVILMIGGHYTYAEVPLFELLKPVFDTERNNYDKLAHFVQGFVPAIVAREILIRKQVVSTRAWMNLFVVCFCLGFSAFYELIEWAVALLAGASSEAFLGTQGYQWDTQSDMALALLGAISALLLLGRRHDRQLRALIARFDS